MNLKKQRELASRTLKVGKERILFVESRLEEIKEAITKQDIRELHANGAILVKEVSGRKTLQRKRKRRTPGNIKKKVKNRKRKYVLLTRKLRGYVSELKKQGRLSREEVKEIRKRIRNKLFRSKAHLRDYIGGLKH